MSDTLGSPSHVAVTASLDEHILVFGFDDMKGGVKTRVYYDEPYLCDAASWQQLFDGSSCELTFCDVNGYVGLLSNQGLVTFEMAKCGSGGGGIEIRVPFASCAQAFEFCRQAKVWERRDDDLEEVDEDESSE